MAGFPEPEVGLVISYSYLWKEEEEQGLVEGRKDRPCAIVLTIDVPAAESNRRKQVIVAPITHSPPHPNVAVEIPPRVKEHLGLDGERSWVILDEVNIFTWPGFDLRPIRRGETRIDYGLLLPKYFDRLIEKFKELRSHGKVAGASRDEPVAAAKG